MSSEPHEIVIIKRHSGGHEDEHHGGVWKIAFADFMTAMMAFFLVMWLISANDKTKAVIARYFNPVQLVDSTPQPKGLEDPKAGSPSVMPKAAAPAPDPKDKADSKTDKTDGRAETKISEGKADTEHKNGTETKMNPNAPAAAGKSEHMDEADLFRDPYAVLAEISGKNQAQPAREQTKASSDGVKGGSGAVGLKGGEAYRDPFEPVPVAAGMIGQPPTTAEPVLPVPGATTPVAQQAEPKPEPPKAIAKAVTSAGPAAQDEKPDQIPNGPSPGTPTKDDLTKPKSATVAPPSLEAKIEAALRQTAATTPGGAVPKLDIHHTSEGTVIDLTDGANFSMFGIASARPAPSMVALMQKIGGLLKTEKGVVTIRGFTDSRPYRTENYDNWRLSAARAHMAHYMLVSGGFDEQRIERIEGYADRQPKNPKDPAAAENRRIEILLRDSGK